MDREPLVRLKTKDEQRYYIIMKIQKLDAEESEAMQRFRERREQLLKRLKKVNGDG